MRKSLLGGRALVSIIAAPQITLADAKRGGGHSSTGSSLPATRGEARMQRHFKKTLSTILAIALLGCAVMFSVSSAKGPYQGASDNAFHGPPLGHTDKALINTHWLDDCTVDSAPVNQAAFDWGFPADEACPKCGFKDVNVKPVVLDVPELLGPDDATAIETIKRKLGINAFRGSIFEDPAPPAAQLFPQGAAPELKAQTCDAACCSKNTTAATTACSTTAAAGGVCNAAKGSCAAGDAVAAASDHFCTAVGECSANASNKNIGVPKDWLISAPLARAVATSIEENAVLALRGASFDLDEAAKQLEACDRYHEADALRQAAQELRIKARELKKLAHVAASPTTNGSAYGSGVVYEEGGYGAANTTFDEPAVFQSPVK
jgi:hypothetical protein